jgi:hypothetical protein
MIVRRSACRLGRDRSRYEDAAAGTVIRFETDDQIDAPSPTCEAPPRAHGDRPSGSQVDTPVSWFHVNGHRYRQRDRASERLPRGPMVAGTSVSVQRIAGWYKLDLSPEEIAENPRHLSLALTTRELYRFPRTTRDLGARKTHVNPAAAPRSAEQAAPGAPVQRTATPPPPR